MYLFALVGIPRSTRYRCFEGAQPEVQSCKLLNERYALKVPLHEASTNSTTGVRRVRCAIPIVTTINAKNCITGEWLAKV